MQEEVKSVTGKVEGMTPDYLEAIKDLKQNSVDRSAYDELKAENKRLLDAVVNGRPAVDDEAAEAKMIPTEKDIHDMRADLFDPEHEYTNLEYVKKVLALREALMLNGATDPFIPLGRQVNPTRDDIDTALKVATVYQECIDYAQGNSEAFTNELMRRTKDIKIIK